MEVTATQAVKGFAELLERVRSDRVTVTITRYGRRIAELKPTEDAMKHAGESPVAGAPDAPL